MRAVIVMVSLMLVGACSENMDSGSDAPGSTPGERYVGVGIYDPDPIWTQQSGSESAAAPNALAANLYDDDKIIVVTDSRTGEIRQCGNLSGRCMVMNPWGASKPVILKKHRQELEAEEEAKTTSRQPGSK